MDLKRLTTKVALSCYAMNGLTHSKLNSILRKFVFTLILIAGAVLLEIRLTYAVCASVLLNLFFQWFGLPFHVVWKTLPRDLRAANRLIRLKLAMWNFSTQNFTIPEAFSKTAKKHPEKTAFLYEKEVWTFQQVENLSNKLANYFLINSGLASDATVGLFLLSRPEFVCLWLGISKAGLVGSLINSQLRGDSLRDSLRACNTKVIVVGKELYENIQEIRDQLPSVAIYVIGTRGDLTSNQFTGSEVDFDLALQNVPDTPILKLKNHRTDRLFYIYTSGTTGLPKAAIITHNRFFYLACGMRKMAGLTKQDILYCTLPLYHTAGGVLGIGQTIFGNTVVIRKKFSASQFWVDCANYNCTVAQYIGEICRYLLVQNPSAKDQGHHIRMMIGNGMRSALWEEFQRRFNVPQITEFYGATEGNASLINIDNMVGAVGFISRLFPFVYPVKLIKVNQETGEPLRDGKGLCIQCGPGETGELVGKIKTSGVHKFDGYCNSEATKKKIAKDVFHKGDLGFLSGDLMEMDQYGYMYFRDRTGDTFRWKGENASTNEIEEIVSRIVGLGSVVVFGVEISGCEGKAGMACILGNSSNHDLSKINSQMKAKLPPFARPLFIRFLSKIEETGTFKLMKSRLREESYNIKVVSRDDSVFYLDPQFDGYLPLTEEAFKRITSGQIRF